MSDTTCQRRADRLDWALAVFWSVFAAAPRLSYLNLAEFKLDEATHYQMAHDLLRGAWRWVGSTASVGLPKPALLVYVLALPMQFTRDPRLITAFLGLLAALSAGALYIPVHDRPRRFGRTHYGISRTMRVILDLFTVRFLLSYSTRPMQLFGGLGLLAWVLGLALGAFLIVARFALRLSVNLLPWALLAVLLVLAGVQLIGMGLLGEVAVRIYYEAVGWPGGFGQRTAGHGSTRPASGTWAMRDDGFGAVWGTRADALYLRSSQDESPLPECLGWCGAAIPGRWPTSF